MSVRWTFATCWYWLLPALAALLGPSAQGQGTIVYVHLPLSNPNGDPNHLPWDSLGTQVGPDLPIAINGQTVCTFTSGPLVAGQPTQFAVQPSSLSEVIVVQPNLPVDQTALVVPLSAGEQIGPSAAGYGWLGNILSGNVLTAARGSGTVGDPFVTEGYFTGLESAYMGFDFQQAGQTYYGWIRAGAPVVGLNAGWVYDYAYETVPNTPILAGQGVPEPSAASLCILAIIAACVCQRKTRTGHRSSCSILGFQGATPPFRQSFSDGSKRYPRSMPPRNQVTRRERHTPEFLVTSGYL